MCPDVCDVCDCLEPRQRWYVCSHCQVILREPCAYRATIGTRDKHFRIFSFVLGIATIAGCEGTNTQLFTGAPPGTSVLHGEDVFPTLLAESIADSRRGLRHVRAESLNVRAFLDRLQLLSEELLRVVYLSSFFE